MKSGVFSRSGKSKKGFSLVEMVVVILLIGIIAAVAAPRMFDTADNARANSTKQNLAVIRDALELYRSQNGGYPTTATIATDLKDYIRGPFPPAQVGTYAGKNAVADTDADPIVAGVATEHGWIYNDDTGEFRVNDTAYLSW
jgi:general secretion pathway protein G